MAETFKVGDTVRRRVLDKPRDPVMKIKTIAGTFAVCTWSEQKITQSNVFRFDQLEHASLSEAASGSK